LPKQIVMERLNKPTKKGKNGKTKQSKEKWNV
jgi:hypothetical protein